MADTSIGTALTKAATTPPAQAAAPNPDAQNAALLAAIASGAHLNTSPDNNGAYQQQQANQAVKALGANIQSIQGGAPAGFAQQQADATKQPFIDAASIAHSAYGANGGAAGAESGAAGNYMSQLHAAIPLVDALARAQVAKANNDYSAQQQNQQYQMYQQHIQQQLDPARLALQKDQLGLDRAKLDYQIANPAVDPKVAAQKQAQYTASLTRDPNLSQGAKDAFAKTVGASSVVDLPSALALLATVQDPKMTDEDKRAASKYIQDYYTNVPYTSAPVQVAQPQQAQKKGGGFLDTLAGLFSGGGKPTAKQLQVFQTPGATKPYGT